MNKCETNYQPNGPAPNPDPKRWKILGYQRFAHAYVLVVQYLDATNFEGIKVMVYQGDMPCLATIERLDPHFSEDGLSPIARFRPTEEGRRLACTLAHNMKGSRDGRILET